MANQTTQHPLEALFHPGQGDELRDRAEAHEHTADMYEHLLKPNLAIAEREQARALRLAADRLTRDTLRGPIE